MSKIEDVYAVAKLVTLEGIEFYSTIFATTDKEKAIKVAKSLAEKEGRALMWEAKCFTKA
jgi:hypothetical protein